VGGGVSLGFGWVLPAAAGFDGSGLGLRAPMAFGAIGALCCLGRAIGGRFLCDVRARLALRYSATGLESAVALFGKGQVCALAPILCCR